MAEDLPPAAEGSRMNTLESFEIETSSEILPSEASSGDPLTQIERERVSSAESFRTYPNSHLFPAMALSQALAML